MKKKHYLHRVVVLVVISASDSILIYKDYWVFWAEISFDQLSITTVGVLTAA